MMRMLWLGVWCMCLYVCGQPALAQQGTDDAPVDRVRLEQRFAAVETLIERSSGARQIESSGVAGALDERDKAREIFRQARTAYDSGQYVRASQLLPQASMRMFEAVRLAAPEEVTGPKVRGDFEARLISVTVLHDAFRRVSNEKTAASDIVETSRDIERRIDQARRLADQGDIEAGRAELDRAYLITKAAVSTLRSGDTLVRTLEFSSKEEEYRYEVDRNDTHQMLIKVLLEGKPETQLSRSYVDRAAQERELAESAAGDGDYAGAIRHLEESTRGLVRAIRSAGVYIPG